MMELYFIDYYNENQNNGLNTYTSELTYALSMYENIHLTVIWINSIKFRELTKYNCDGIGHIHIPAHVKSVQKQNDFDVTLAHLVLSNINIDENVVIHLNWIHHLSLAWHLKQKIICKIILTKHCLPWRDLVINNYNEFYKLNKAYTKQKRMNIAVPQLQQEQQGYSNVDHIIAVTQSAKYSLTHLFKISSEKITVIHNGISASTLYLNQLNGQSGKKAKLRAKYGFCLNEQLILFAGNVHTRKGIIDVVTIFDDFANIKGFRNLRLVIAGPGDHSLVLKVAKKSWGKITLTGSLDKTTLYDFYAIADIGIAPSYAEQCSYTVIEMMNAGLPLIVSDVDGLKEMVNDNCGLRVKVDFKKTGASINAKDLREKIRFYLGNPSEAKLLAANAKKYAMNHFTAERMVKETIAVYEKVLLEETEREELKGEIEKLQVATNDLDQKPLVSIIIPCYNAEKYLQESLNSVVSQNYTHFELIVIDDGSTDDTSKLITSFKDKRIIYIKNHQNKGITYTLNKAIKLAKGKYIARLDADDTMLPERLSVQIEFLEKNPDYGMVGAHHYVIDTHGMPIQRMEPFENNDELKLNLLFANPFAHPVITMRSEIVKASNYDNNFAYCEDYDLWFRIAQKYKVKNLPVPLLNYRVHAQNSSANNNKVMKQNVLNLLSRELDNLGISHTPEELMLHAAISFKYQGKYFNTDEKLKNLHRWLDKIFSSPNLVENYSQHKLKKFKKHILLDYCGITNF